MIQMRCPYMAGTVGFIAANSARYLDFFDSLERLSVPVGTALVNSIHYSAAHNRNGVIDMAVGDWILFLDDDHSWNRDLLFNMLERDVDILTVPYCQRFPPFLPVLYKCYHPDAPDGLDDHIWKQHTWEELSGHSGLMEVQACGFGAVLVKMHVIDRMKEYWGAPLFRVGRYDDSWKVSHKDIMAEDLSFCWAARKAGFKVMVDLELQLGHITETTLVAGRDKEGKLRAMADISGRRQWIS